MRRSFLFALLFFDALLIVFLFTLDAANIAGAQTSSTRLTGTVRDGASGKPIQGAVVTIEGNLPARAIANNSGAFAFVDLTVNAPYQLVTITVRASGYGGWTMRETLLYPGVTRVLDARLDAEPQVIVAGLPRALTRELTAVSAGPKQSQQAAPNYFSNDVPPSTIRVAITNYANCAAWVAAGQPVVRVDVVDFKQYAKNVLPNEWYASWGNDAPDSLRAGAMAVKMFAWNLVNKGWRKYLPGNPDVVDNTCDQRYVPNTQDPRTDEAVEATWNMLMRRNGIVIEIHYLATPAQCQASSLQPCMPQWGTYYDALAGYDWESILHRYYDPVAVTGLSVMSLLTTDANGNPKDTFNAGDTIRYYGQVYNDTASAQDAFFDWSTIGPCGSIAAWSGNIATESGKWWYPLPGKVPGNACVGAYTYTLAVTFGSMSSSLSKFFSVINTSCNSSASCSTPAPTPSPTPTTTPQVITTTIDAASGGAVATDDNSLRIVFPVNAVSVSTTVTYTTMLTPSLPIASGRIPLRSFNLQARSSTGQVITQTLKPYTVTLAFNGMRLPMSQVSGSTLNVSSLFNGGWKDLLPCAGCSFGPVNNQVTAAADYFGEFVFIANSEPVLRFGIYLPFVSR